MRTERAAYWLKDWNLFLQLNLVPAALSFFLGRASIMGEVHPFGLAFFALVLFRSFKTSLLLSILIFAGTFTAAGPVVAGRIGINMLALFLLYRWCKQYFAADYRRFALTVMILSAFLSIITAMFFSLSFYTLFVAVLESLLQGFLAALFIRCYPLLWNKRELQAEGIEKRLAAMVVAGAFLAGLEGISWGHFDIQHIVAMWLVLIAANSGRADTGAIAGVFIGLIVGLSSPVLPIAVTIYALVGLLGGFFRDYGRLGSVMGMAIAGSFAALYVEEAGGVLFLHLEMALAAVLFFLTPELAGRRVARLLTVQEDQPPLQHEASTGSITVGRLEDFADRFVSMAGSLERGMDAWERNGDADLTSLINTIFQRVCRGCPGKEECWERNFYRRFTALTRLIGRLEQGDELEYYVPVKELKKECKRSKELMSVARQLIAGYRQDRFWRERLQRARGIMADQLRGFGEVVEGLACELKHDTQYYSRLEREIRRKLSERGFAIRHLKLQSFRRDRIGVLVERAACGGKDECRRRMQPLLEGQLEESLDRRRSFCSSGNEKGSCIIEFVPRRKLAVKKGVAASSGENYNVSGDSCAFRELRDGTWIALLSDGMGSGGRAAFESKGAVSLFMHMIEIGYRRELALKILNSLLLVRSAGRESFATLDLLALDLYSGYAEFIKVGASPAYIKRGRKLFSIDSRTLPVGIMENIDFKPQEMELRAGDRVIMFTDGVLESFWKNDGEKWLLEYLKRARDEPSAMAQKLLNAAHEAEGAGGARQIDDMTVVVMELERAGYRTLGDTGATVKVGGYG